MKILMVHNYYREPGGEDHAFDAEATVLARHGHDVRKFERASADHTQSIAGVLRTAVGTPWARTVVAALQDELSAFRPDVVHFHNTFPLISPAAYYACRRAGIPVVQTLHNYRLLCAKAELFRDGKVCEECVGTSLALPALQHRCYRDSLAGTAAVAGMLSLHKAIGTWDRTVDCYVALTEFARDKFVEGGLPADRIRVKANFLLDAGPVRNGSGEFAVYIGRLSQEKGLETLMEAWKESAIPLRIIGSGPLESRVRAWAETRKNVQVLGWIPREQVRRELGHARFLVMPSLWYEGFPIVLLEAMASAVPAIASNRGSLVEIQAATGGMTFDAADASALAAAAERLWHDTDENERLGQNARRSFDRQFNADAGYRNLLALYEEVVGVASTARVHPTSIWIENTPVANLDLHDTVAVIGEWLDDDRPRRIATANLDFLRLASSNAELAGALRTADLVTADGTPLLWLAELAGKRLPERVAGADLILPLMGEAARRGRSVFLLGGSPGAADEAARMLLLQYPTLRIAGTAAPMLRLDDAASCQAAIDVVAATSPDLVLVALGCPKQDLFLSRHLESLNCRVGIGVGASLDFLAGKVRRAPGSVQRAGLEWAFRLSQEPGRLGTRYASDFVFLLRAAARAYSARRAAEQRRARTSDDAPDT